MGLDRRSFISLVAGGVVGSLCTPVVWKSLDDVSIWTQNWSWIPRLNYGAEKNLPAICKLGADAYGINIKTVGGNPVVAEGNPTHPLSLGGICPLGASSVQLLYSPSRVKGPKKKNGKAFQDISWEEAESLLAEQLKAAGADVAAISGDDTGSTADVLAGVVGKLGSKKMFFMPGEAAPAAQALAMFGGNGQVGYDLENASYVLMLGADVLGSWANVARNGKAFAASREKVCKFVYVGPALNSTSAVADSWVPCAAGKEPLLAMGIANVLSTTGVDKSLVPGFAAFAKFVQANYPLDKVAAETGVSEDVIKGLAGELNNSGRPLVLAAAEAAQGLSALEAAAGMCVNILLGRINETGGVKVMPWAPKVVAAAAEKKALLANDVVAYLSAVADGSEVAPKLLLVQAANPAYALPNLKKAQAAIDKTGFVVSFSSFMDETAEMADLILPDCYAFERMDDAYSPYGSALPNYTAVAPVIKPVFNTKACADVLIAASAKAGADLGVKSLEDVIKAKAKTLGADLGSLIKGKVWVAKTCPGHELSLWNTQMKVLTAPAKEAKSLALVASNLLKIGSAKTATAPFGTNAIRFDEMLGKDMYVMMNGVTAKAFGLKADDAVKLANAGGECKARVRIFEGVMNDTVVAPLGFGHTAWDDFSRGKGDNVYKLLVAAVDAGFSSYSSARVTVSKA